ncbi:MAG: FkbM family methyltransferase [Propylenella sp.]
MPSKLLKLALRPLGYTISKHEPRLDERSRLALIAKARGVSLFLDVGASRGQFARNLLKAGYEGRIVSFEPLTESHAQLMKAAADEPRWQVYRRCALGPEAGSARINVAGNLQSSSFLPMLERHVRAAPHSRYVGTEETEIVTLDHILGANFPGAKPVGLKLDVQGYERQVLEGLVEHRARVAVIYAELPLTPMYEGATGFVDMFGLLGSWGFRCVSIEPNFVDPETYEVLEVNGLFVSDRVARGGAP